METDNFQSNEHLDHFEFYWIKFQNAWEIARWNGLINRFCCVNGSHININQLDEIDYTKLIRTEKQN